MYTIKRPRRRHSEETSTGNIVNQANDVEDSVQIEADGMVNDQVEETSTGNIESGELVEEIFLKILF